jgi:hypothetical protein
MLKPVFVAKHFSTKVSINTFVSYCIRSHRRPNDIYSYVSE